MHRNQPLPQRVCAVRSDVMSNVDYSSDIYEREYTNYEWNSMLSRDHHVRRIRIDPYEEELNEYYELYIDLYDFGYERHDCGLVYFERQRNLRIEHFFLALQPEGLRFHLFNRLRLSLTRAMDKDFGHPNRVYLFKYWYDQTGRETGGFIDAHQFFFEYGRLFLKYVEDGIGAQGLIRT